MSHLNSIVSLALCNCFQIKMQKSDWRILMIASLCHSIVPMILAIFWISMIGLSQLWLQSLASKHVEFPFPCNLCKLASVPAKNRTNNDYCIYKMHSSVIYWFIIYRTLTTSHSKSANSSILPPMSRRSPLYLFY